MNRLNNSLSSDAEQVEHLLNRYSGLVDRADALAFPSLRKGVLAPIETTHWSVPRRIMFRLVSPFSFLWSPPSGHNPFSVVIMAWIFGIWMVTFALWGVTLMAAIEVLRDVIANTAIPPSSSALPAALGYALFLYLMLAGFLMYWRWLEFWRDRRFFWYWRGMLTIVFIVGFVALSLIAISPAEWLQGWRDLLGHPKLLALFVLLGIFFVVPMATFLYFLFLEAILCLTWMLGTLLSFVLSLHQTYSLPVIRELTLVEIQPSAAEQPAWRLLALPASELRTLREWAATNREATDKRLLPMTVLFAGIGLFCEHRCLQPSDGSSAAIP